MFSIKVRFFAYLVSLKECVTLDRDKENYQYSEDTKLHSMFCDNNLILHREHGKIWSNASAKDLGSSNMCA